MPAYSHVLEEQEHLGSADLDSCPDCGDVMVRRGDDKACAGCGTRQPIVTVQARKHDWAFVAKMAVAANEFWRRKAVDDGSLEEPYEGEDEVDPYADVVTPGQPVTAEQIDQVFQAAMGFPAREADKQIIAQMGGTSDVFAEYLWDHWMGEPEHLTVGQVQHEIEYVLGMRDTNFMGEQPHLSKTANALVDATANQLVKAWDELYAEQEGDIGLTLKYFDSVSLDIIEGAAEKAGITSTEQGDDEAWDKAFQDFEAQIYEVVFKTAPEIKAAMTDAAHPPSQQDYI